MHEEVVNTCTLPPFGVDVHIEYDPDPGVKSPALTMHSIYSIGLAA